MFAPRGRFKQTRRSPWVRMGAAAVLAPGKALGTDLCWTRSVRHRRTRQWPGRLQKALRQDAVVSRATTRTIESDARVWQQPYAQARPTRRPGRTLHSKLVTSLLATLIGWAITIGGLIGPLAAPVAPSGICQSMEDASPALSRRRRSMCKPSTERITRSWCQPDTP